MKKTGLILSILLAFSGMAQAEQKLAAQIAEIRIYFSDTFSKKINEKSVRALLSIHEGDIFSSQKIDESLNALRKWGVFETINTSATKTNNGFEIDIFLKEAILIGEIDIAGNYPYIEPKIKKYLTIRPGDMYTRERIEEQKKRILGFYEREGFFNTSVDALEEWNETSRDVKIKFTIRRGSLLRYGTINVTGAHAFPKGRIASTINPLRPYKPRHFNDAIRKSSDFYHRHGYPRARIEVKNKEINVEKGKINADLHVSEGPKVSVDFIGNKNLSSKKLKKALTIYEEGSFDEFEIDASQNSLIKMYNKYGYPDTKIDNAKKISNDGSVLVEFRIAEGPRQRIRKINLAGNKSISSRRLKKQMKTKEVSLTTRGIYKKEVLKEDSEAVKKYYGSEGFLKAEVNDPIIEETRSGLNITIPVLEDGHTKVNRIEFTGNSAFSKDTLLKQLKNRAGKSLDQTELEADRQAVLVYYADNAYPYAEAKQLIDLHEGSIKYEIAEVQKVQIGEILVVGNSLTQTKAIKKAMAIHEGDSFSYKKITDSQLALRRLGAFNAVSIDTIGLEEREKVVHLRVKVEEQKPFVLDFEFGYSTDERYTGSINFTNHNSFGMAKRSNLRLTGGQELSRAEINWTDPRFLGGDFEMTTSSWLQYEDKNIFNYLQTGGGLGFFRKYHRTGILAKYELTRNYFVEGDSVAADIDSLRDNTISKVALSASFDTRNSFSEPTRGIFAMMNTNFYNEIRGKEANFVKLRWFFGQHTGFLKYFSIANNLRADRIQAIGNNVSIPSNELFQAGGDDTLRGFVEDSLGPVNATGQAIGGKMRWIYNGELRIKLYRNWRLAGFYDTGALVNELNQIDLDSVRQSAGFGLRYLTPVGPMRLDYGMIIDRKPGEHFGRYHFTFGYVF
jgi:outer membrane protein insertion porin family